MTKKILLAVFLLTCCCINNVPAQSKVTVQPETGIEAYIPAVKKINTKKYDRKIKKIIKRNSDLNKVGGLVYSYVAMDSIVEQISRLPFVSETLWDKCATKIAIYPGWNIIGVILMIEGKPVEKIYTVQVGKLVYFKLFKKRLFQLSNDNNALVYKGSQVSPGFINKERENCMQQ